MPLKAKTSPQNITLAEASKFMNAMQALGVPISDLREISTIDGQYISVNDPDYQDDGLVHEFVVNSWGKDTIVGLDEMTVMKGGFNNLLSFATTCFTVNGGVSPAATYSAAVQAVLALNGVMPAIDKLLTIPG